MKTRGRNLLDCKSNLIKVGDILQCDLGRIGIFLGFGIFDLKTKKVEKRLNNLCFKMTNKEVILTDWEIVGSLSKEEIKKTLCMALSQDKTLIGIIQNRKNMLNSDFYQTSFYEKRVEL